MSTCFFQGLVSTSYDAWLYFHTFNPIYNKIPSLPQLLDYGEFSYQQRIPHEEASGVLARAGFGLALNNEGMASLYDNRS